MASVTTSPRPRRAAKYRRISDDREGKELGITRQDEDLDELGEHRNLVYVGNYFDNDCGASTKSRKKKRDGYARLLADARAGKFEVITAYTTSRLTRRPLEFEDLIALAQDPGTEFMYVRSPEFDLKTARGREFARMMAARDAGEAEETAERVARAMLQRAKDGKFHGSRRSYGLTLDGSRIVRAEAKEIRRWYTDLLAGGSLWGIRADLEQRGVPTVYGGPWSQAVIRNILLSPRNAGLRVLHGVEYKAANPRIVPVATWRAAVRELQKPERRTNKAGNARLYAGTGLYLCQRCTVAVNTGYKTKGSQRYKCLNCWRSWQLELVDGCVFRAVDEVLARADAKERLLPRRDEGVDIAALDTEATAIRENMAVLTSQFALARGDTRAALEAGLATGQARLDEIAGIVADVGRVGPLAAVLLADDPVAAWRGLRDLSRRQAVIRTLMTVELGAPPRGRPGSREPDSYIHTLPAATSGSLDAR